MNADRSTCDANAGPAGSQPFGDDRYPRDARMAKPAEFDRGLRRPPVYRSGPFALHLCWLDAAADAGPVWRLGLVIPKRYEASAVGRNTIKRRWRDAFRRGRGAWAGEFGSADLVVRLQAPLVPLPPKRKPTATKGRDATAAQVAPVSLGARQPARIRARDRFDPAPMLDGLIGRLRSRNRRPDPVASGASAASGATALQTRDVAGS